MQSFSLRETLILVLNLQKTHLGRCLCSAKNKCYLVINWNINYRARDATVYWVTTLGEPPCNPPQPLPRTFVKAGRWAFWRITYSRNHMAVSTTRETKMWASVIAQCFVPTNTGLFWFSIISSSEYFSKFLDNKNHHSEQWRKHETKVSFHKNVCAN